MPKGRVIAFFLLFIPLYCIAQTNDRLPLSAILRQISKAHDVKFSYIDEELAVYVLVPPAKKLKLTDKIEYLQKNTRLQFEATGTKNYTIYNDVKMDKPLCGYLTDAKTGKPVENAQIMIQGKAFSTNSDAKGYFELPVLIPNTIIISHIGYTDKTIVPAELYVPDCPVIYLEEKIIELDEVITQRYLASGISKNATVELIVKPRKFGILPGLTDPDVLQTMQQLPGVISIDETVSNINVRGGTHDQNLFLWNGIRMFQTSHFFGLISAFNPLQATNISIYKNGSPAFYGESVSSLVDISTHTQIQDSCYNAIAVDMVNANFMSMVKLSDKDRLQFSGRRTFSDIWTSPTFKDYQHRVFQNTTITDVLQNQEVPVISSEEFYFYDLSFSYQRKLSNRHELLVDGIGMENNLQVAQHTDTADRQGELKQRNYGGGAAIKSKWDENNESEIHTYISLYDLDAFNEAIENEQTTHQSNTILDKGIRLKYSHSFSPVFNVSAGYQFNEISMRNFDEVNVPAFSKNEKLVSVSHIGILQANYTCVNGKTTAIAGIRGNYFDKYELYRFEPRVSFSHKITDGLTIEVLGEQKSQTVSQIIDLQQDFLGIEKRRWVLSDGKDIPIQKSTQVSVGLNYSKNGWFASVEGFYKRISGITSDSQGFQNQFEFMNSTGRYTVTGGEFLLQKKFNHIYGWISYSYNDNNYHFDGFLPPGFANNFAVSHAVTSAGIYEWNNLRIALGAKWRTGTPFTEPESFNIDPNNPANSQITYRQPNSTILKDNIQLNFSASKTWDLGPKTAFTASCSILNILDRKNIINRYYRINTTDNTVESVNTYGLGRTPNIALKIIF